MTNPMQLPLLDPSLHGRTHDDAVVWQPSRDLAKSWRPTLDDDIDNQHRTTIPAQNENASAVSTTRPPSRAWSRLARFGLTSLIFGTNSFLCQSAVYLARERYWDGRLGPALDGLVAAANLSPHVAAVARETVCVLLWTCVIVAEFYLVRSASLRSMALWRRQRRTGNKGGDSNNASKAADGSERGEADGGGIGVRDDVADHFDGAFTVGSTLGCAAYVAALHGWWEVRGELPPIGKRVYGIWAVVLFAALVTGFVPMAQSVAREEGARRTARIRTAKRVNWDEC